MGLSYDQLFPGRFLKAGEFNGRAVTLTIADVFLDGLETETGNTETRAIMAFTETDRQLVLIKTNAQCLRAMWGDDSGEWVGHKVTFHPERDPSGLSDSGLCIRVKGSPELERELKVEIKLPRRRPQVRKLVPTAKSTPEEDDHDDDYTPDLVPDGEEIEF